MNRFWRLFRTQINVQLRVRTFNWFNLSLFLFQPVIFSTVGIMFARAAGKSAPDLVYTIIGGGIMGMWSGLVFTSTFDILRDRRDGMLELIVGSPTSLELVEGIRNFTNVMAGCFSLALAVGVAAVVYNYPLREANLLGALISLGLVLLGFWCMGMVLCNFLAWARLSGPFINFLETPIAVICGFMYPISVMPGWMQQLSAIFPIRWALSAMNLCIRGEQSLQPLWPLWLISIGVSGLYWLISKWLAVKVHDKIRVSGELSST